MIKVKIMKVYLTDNFSNQIKAYVNDFSKIYRKALCFSINQKLSSDIGKSQLNTLLQSTFKINKRYSNSVINDADGKIDSAKECRNNHIKQLEGKLKSAEKWLKTAEKNLKDSKKFYYNKKWQNKKSSCKLRLCCYLDTKKNSWQFVKFRIHHKKRYIEHLKRKINQLKSVPVRVSVNKQGEAYFLGSKDETCGNQICQLDNQGNLRIRVAACLEKKYGKYLTGKVSFAYGQENIQLTCANNQAKTFRFFAKDFKWFISLAIDTPSIPKKTNSRHYGCLGIDINPNSIGYAITDPEGNLWKKGQIKFDVSSQRRGQTLAVISNVVNELLELSLEYKVPIVCENLEFSVKKEQLRERGRKYARMLSNFAYSRFIRQLELQGGNRGIEVIKVNPAYSSFLGLIKYCKMYGLASDEAAALVLARRAMRLSERVPRSIKAFIEVNSRKHSWSVLNQLNKKLAIKNRHDFYGITNRELEVKLLGEEGKLTRPKGKLRSASNSKSS